MLHFLTSPTHPPGPFLHVHVELVPSFLPTLSSGPLCLGKLTFGMQSDSDLPDELVPFQFQLGTLGLPPSFFVGLLPSSPNQWHRGRHLKQVSKWNLKEKMLTSRKGHENEDQRLKQKLWCKLTKKRLKRKARRAGQRKAREFEKERLKKAEYQFLL